MKTGSPLETAATPLAAAPGQPLRSHAGFDAEKVRALRQAIAEGSFRVDAEAIAARLLAGPRLLPHRDTLPH